MIILNILAFYMLVAVGAYLYVALGDYIWYKMKGKLDNKFPINSIETHKFIAVMSLFWFPLVLIFLKNSVKGLYERL